MGRTEGCVVASLELARRLARSEVPRSEPMKRPLALVQYLALRYSTIGQEVLGAVYLDARSRLIEDREIYLGTLDRSPVEPREIFHHALLVGAATVVVWHTHTSGDPSPSPEDLAFTRRLAQAGEALGVGLVDHLIVGHGGRWLSLHERGVC